MQRYNHLICKFHKNKFYKARTCFLWHGTGLFFHARNELSALRGENEKRKFRISSKEKGIFPGQIDPVSCSCADHLFYSPPSFPYKQKHLFNHSSSGGSAYRPQHCGAVVLYLSDETIEKFSDRGSSSGQQKDADEDERAYSLSHAAIGNGLLVGLTEAQDTDCRLCGQHICDMAAKEGIEGFKADIYRNLDEYTAALKDLVRNKEKPDALTAETDGDGQEEIKDKNIGADRDARAAALILSISL